MSGFLNHCNDAEGIYNFEDLCKYGHICQAKGEPAPIPIPPLKQTNKHDFSLRNNLIPLCMVWQCPKLKMSFTRPH